MTTLEAITNFRKLCFGCLRPDDCTECEIFIAGKALEKQMPKKPIKNRSEYYCAECGTYGESYTCVGKNHRDGHKTRHDYCFNCGQKIDWSDENG